MCKKFLQFIALLLSAIMVSAVFSACSSAPIQYSFPCLIAETEAEINPVRPIDSAATANFTSTKDAPIETQLRELLEITAIDKNRPLLDRDNIWQDVERAYQEAVSVLNRYIKNDYDDFQKVLAIHDYLASQIVYDHDLYNRYLANPDSAALTDPAFELTGVFLNKKAVCNGISKAFMLLCGIEGIDARYVRGNYIKNGESIAHAWNKVNLKGIWYNVDVTMDNFTLTVGSRPISLLNHGYFLRSDRSIYLNGSHEESPAFQQWWVIPEASGEYDYYARNLPGIADCPMTVENADELQTVFKKVKASANPRVGAVEVKLDFFDGEMSNDFSDYIDPIQNAYRAAKSDFSYTPGKPPPFTQYPCGVFVFLIQ